MLKHLGSPSDPVRVLILGARGFVAAATASYATSLGWNTRAVASSEVDLTAPASVDRLAAILSPDDTLIVVSALTPDRGRDIETMMCNLAMGQHVCAALERRPCAHVINVGSDAVYDDAANPVRETSNIFPTPFHGVMHFTREHMITDTCRRLKVPVALLRPSLLYGPRDTHNGYGPNRFVRTAVNEGRIALFGNGEEQRDHVFIDDVARLITEVTRRRSEGVLNIATGRSHSFGQIASLIARFAPRETKIEPSTRSNAISHRHFDVSALIAALPGFRFTTLEDGLAHSIRALA